MLNYPIPLQYQLTEEDMRKEFGKYGEIKSLFDLVEKRGMVFLTYVSVRKDSDDRYV